MTAELPSQPDDVKPLNAKDYAIMAVCFSVLGTIMVAEEIADQVQWRAKYLVAKLRGENPQVVKGFDGINAAEVTRVIQE